MIVVAHESPAFLNKRNAYHVIVVDAVSIVHGKHVDIIMHLVNINDNMRVVKFVELNAPFFVSETGGGPWQTGMISNFCAHCTTKNNCTADR